MFSKINHIYIYIVIEKKDNSPQFCEARSSSHREMEDFILNKESSITLYT